MITLEAPHMALNSNNMPCIYQMWNTWGWFGTTQISGSELPSKIVKWVAVVARGAPGGKLKNLVINCHGAPGYLELGTGFSRRNVGLFTEWKGLVEKIWISACSVAFIEKPGTDEDGNLFCGALAKNVGCYVVVATEMQRSKNQAYPYGKIDGFEGLVLSYGPDGVTWSRRYSPNPWWGG